MFIVYPVLENRPGTSKRKCLDQTKKRDILPNTETAMSPSIKTRNVRQQITSVQDL
jgi:hypothetical protein